MGWKCTNINYILWRAKLLFPEIVRIITNGKDFFNYLVQFNFQDLKMKNVYVLLLILLFSFQLFAGNDISLEENASFLNCQLFYDSNIFDLKRKGYQGCCSHHRGVCGCDGWGWVTCCDGSSSPTCRC